jgi:threonine aldolase
MANLPERFFASDNCSGIHPAIMSAIADANLGHVKGYGYDPFTAEAENRFKSLFGAQAEVFFTYGGTGANVIGLQACLRPFEAVICSETAHIHTDECGAPERFLQSKLIVLPHTNGKIKVEQLPELLTGRGVEHHVQPRVVSITQSTEYGTVYTLQEMNDLGEFCKANQLYFHVDGARFSNACATLNVSPAELITQNHVDILSFGGTKNGLLIGEAVVVLNPELAQNLKYIRKQSMQLFSKMRFISAQFNAFLNDGLWLKLARHSNAMATQLAAELQKIPGVKITQPVEANEVFVIFPEGIGEKLQELSPFYTWNEGCREMRLVCSWDSNESDIQQFIDITLRQLEHSLKAAD